MIGYGATVCYWTDRRAATIINMTRCTITVQLDEATRIDQNGISENQQYSYKADPKGQVMIFRKNKYGRYIGARGGAVLRVGERDEYYDYSF